VPIAKAKHKHIYGGTVWAIIPKVVEASIATARQWFIIRPLLRMKKLGRVLFIGVLVFSPISRLVAQSDDPSEIFLKAYMTSQQGEKLEHDNQFKAALAKYRFAGSLLEELRKRHSDWQPAIVEYRSRKVAENILRVQDKAATQSDLATGSTPLPGAAPVLPEQPGSEPSVEVIAPRTGQAPAPAPPAPIVIQPRQAGPAPQAPPPAQTVNDEAVREATKKLQSRVDELQSELDKSRNRFSSLEGEKETLNKRLEETDSKLTKAQSELDKSKTEASKIRDQLNGAQNSLKKVQASSGADTKGQEALRAEIAGLKKALEGVEQGRKAAEKERDQANTKAAQAEKQIASLSKERDDAKTKATQAGQQIASITKERDDALTQLKGIKGGEQRIQVLLAENSSLKQKLADAEKAVRELSADKPKKEKDLADVKGQIDQLQQQLAASQKQNQDSESKLVTLRSQLDEANAQLEHAKLTGITAEETARLTKENQILRNIVIRERQEEARRDQAKKLMLAEFDKLKVKSDTLTQQVELLAQPVTRLSDEELALLRQPVVSISDNNPTAMTASFAFAKKTTATSAPPASNQPDKLATADNGSAPAGSDTNAPGGFKPLVPDNLVSVAREAKESFDRGKYRSAEKKYQEILIKSPNNLYSLSNLGVVYFRTGRLKAAELTLKKAVAIAPRDEFSHTTLGIVFYRQAKFDEALTELTRALGINPKSATAHNYLGITASQKGWQEAAEKEMLEAIANNPDYADAHFNLAVIYATAQPPAKELAKRHYTRATSLGAQPDPSLEKLLH
jgi:Flp pilus assembly protein TadD/predicted  nucleic acid-binding Zn-ribbon protein